MGSKKNQFFICLALLSLLSASCATSSIKVHESITKQISVKEHFKENPVPVTAEFLPAEHYLFDEKGREIFYDGFEGLRGYVQPNLLNNEKRIKEYDENGNITRNYRLNFETPTEGFRSYYPDGSVSYSYAWEDDEARFDDDSGRGDDWHEYWYDESGKVIKKRARLRTVDENYNFVPSGDEEEPAEYFEYDSHDNLIRRYDEKAGEEYFASYDYDENGNILHSFKDYIDYGLEEEEWYVYNQDNKLVSGKSIGKVYVDETKAELESYEDGELVNSYRPDGLITSTKITFCAYTDASKKTVSGQYVTNELYEYDDKNRLILHTSNTDSSEDNEDESSWEKYEYAADGSYIYTSNKGYRQDIMQKNFSAEGKLLYEKTYTGHQIWYDEKGRKYREDNFWVEYDDKDRIIYDKMDGNVVEESWWHYDENDRLYGFEHLVTHTYETNSMWDKKREIWITFDAEGFPLYSIETELWGIHSKEMECRCTERFYINKYARYRDGTIKECLQYRYLNHFNEWVENY